MGQQSGKEIDVTSIWKQEAKLSQKERRKRYRCKKFVPIEEIVSWKDEVDKVINEESLASIAQDLKQIKAVNETIKQYSSSIEELQKQKTKLEEKADSSGKENSSSDDSSDENRNRDEPKSIKELNQKLKKLQRNLQDKNQEKSELEGILDLKKVRGGSHKGSDQLNVKVSLLRGDITTLELDAIVNAANKSLLGGGGVDGAIHSKAGDRLYEECKTLGGGETGQTKITRGYDLPAKFVLHTVGPVGEKEELLVSCYTGCMDLVLKHKIKTVAFCGISTGIYGYPLYEATHVALGTIRKWLEDEKQIKKIDRIIFCTFLEKELVCYQKLMPLYFPPEGKTTEDVINMYKNAANQNEDDQAKQKEKDDSGKEEDSDE